MPTCSSKGGVLLYVKNDIHFKPREDLSNMLYKSKELESVFIEVIGKKAKNYIIGTIYRHPSMDANIFNEEYLKQFVTKLSSENKNCYLAGDFNFDLQNSTNSSVTNEFFETMMSNFILPSITLPTRINNRTGNRTVIDNIFTNYLHPDMITGNLTINISDHLPSFLIVPKQNQNHLPKKHNLFKRDTRNFDKEHFLQEFSQVEWDTILETEKNDPNHSISNLLSRLNELLDKHMPLRKLKQKEFKKRYKPWIKNNILNKIEYKNKIYKRFLNTKNAAKRNMLNERVKYLKNEITTQIRQSKKEYYSTNCICN